MQIKSGDAMVVGLLGAAAVLVVAICLLAWIVLKVL
jgi:hypothetical protein